MKRTPAILLAVAFGFATSSGAMAAEGPRDLVEHLQKQGEALKVDLDTTKAALKKTQAELATLATERDKEKFAKEAALAEAALQHEEATVLREAVAAVKQQLVNLGRLDHGADFKTTLAKLQEALQRLKLPTRGTARLSFEEPASDDINKSAVQVHANGTLVMNSKEISLEVFRERVTALAKLNPDYAIILRGDDTTPYQYIARVLKTCNDAGIWNLALPVSKSE